MECIFSDETASEKASEQTASALHDLWDDIVSKIHDVTVIDTLKGVFSKHGYNPKTLNYSNYSDTESY